VQSRPLNSYKHFSCRFVPPAAKTFMIMADNKDIQDGRDRSKVNGNESYELSYIEEKLGVSREQVREAIDAVGNNREAVEAWLNKKSNK
jgi:hypothetical protein